MPLTSKSKTILGIDPGFERLGMAIVSRRPSGEEVIYSTCATTPAKLDFADRLVMLGNQFKTLLDKHQPDAVALEKLFFSTNKKTASQVSEVRGMLIYLATKAGFEVLEYTPLQIKSTVAGHGKADKKQVTEMVKRLVKMKTSPKHDDEYDAIAVALTALAHQH